MRPNVKAGLAHFLTYLLAAAGLTWPLVRHLNSHLPLGTEGAATVPLFNLWTLLWNSSRLAEAYHHYWQAPIFFPDQAAFALSDPQPLTGLLFTPLYLVSGSAVTAYNLLLLLILTLNACTAAYLWRRLGIAPQAAFLGGLLALGLPFIGSELGVLQLTVLFPIFLALAALWRFGQQPALAPALALGLWAAVTFLTSGYYGLFLTIFLLLGGLLLAQRHHFSYRAAGHLLAGILLAGLLLAPFLPAQAHLTGRYRRIESSIDRNSAHPLDYLRSNRYSLAYPLAAWQSGLNGSGQRLFPGATLLLLAGLGLYNGRRVGLPQRWLLLVLAGGACACWLSLGPRPEIGGWQPYDLWRRYVPGFAQLRSPFRIALFGQLFLLSLAAFGLAGLWAKPGRRGRWAAFLLTTLALLETVVLPARLYQVPSAVRQAAQQPWVRWLQEDEPAAVLMLPMAAGPKTIDFEPTVLAMVQGLTHERPLANGYSGFFPTSYRRLQDIIDRFPNENSLAYLETLGIEAIVIDRSWLTPEHQQALAAHTQWQPVHQDTEKVIYRLLSP